ncbi:aldehyde dehydrogenase family protein [Jatrophihabitans sp. YIM 134969]
MLTSTSPQRPDDVVVSVPAASAADVEKAAATARDAQHDWARDPGPRAVALTRAADVVEHAADELADLVVREVGKPVTEARGEVARSVAILRYNAQQALDPSGDTFGAPGTTLSFTTRRPRGVAGLVTPWNFPLAIPLWKAAPALATGNAVLLKPSEESTACALRLGELLAPVLPEGLFAVLPGGTGTGRAVTGAADVVSFTGSTAVGQQVVRDATSRGVRVQAEMGGQNPAIVLPDADVRVAAASIAAAIAGFAGQKCTATKRVIVVGDATAFTDALVAAVEALGVGDPAEPAVAVGPVVTDAARTRVLDAVGSARASGGRVLTGGTAPAGAGWFVAPTLVDGLPADHLLECDEVFGPICTVAAVPTLEAAVERANAVRFGLVGAVYGRDLAAVLDVTGRLATGMIKVNAPTTGVDFWTPFGGVKESGYGGKEQGKAAVDVFTTTHTVTIAAG